MHNSAGWKSETREKFCHSRPHRCHSVYVHYIHDIPRVGHQLDSERFLGARAARIRRRRFQGRQPLTRMGSAGPVIFERKPYSNITVAPDSKILSGVRSL